MIPECSVVTELIIGYVLPGRPIGMFHINRALFWISVPYSDEVLPPL